MKHPMIDKCPCCEAEVVETEHKYNEHGVMTRCEISTGNVSPVCKQAVNGDGTLAAATLHWRCNVCGCEWQHGQYEDDAEGNDGARSGSMSL